MSSPSLNFFPFSGILHLLVFIFHGFKLPHSISQLFFYIRSTLPEIIILRLLVEQLVNILLRDIML